MEPNRRLLALLVLLFASWSSGCIDWYIAAPQHSVVLVQVDANRTERDLSFPQTPILRQRQIGLFNLSIIGGTPLIPLTEIQPDVSFAQRPELPLEGVALCTSYGFSDVLITIFTLNFVASRKVSIYADVR